MAKKRVSSEREECAASFEESLAELEKIVAELESGKLGLSDALSRIPAGRNLRLEVHSELMDHAGFEAIESFRESHERTGAKVEIRGKVPPFESIEMSASSGMHAV